jgi:hypothetical protein
MWTSAGRVGDFLEGFEAQPADLRHAPFFTEQLEMRRRDSKEFYRGLERNGARAVAEFARAEELWGDRARAARKGRFELRSWRLWWRSRDSRPKRDPTACCELAGRLPAPGKGQAPQVGGGPPMDSRGRDHAASLSRSPT